MLKLSIWDYKFIVVTGEKKFNLSGDYGAWEKFNLLTVFLSLIFLYSTNFEIMFAMRLMLFGRDIPTETTNLKNTYSLHTLRSTSPSRRCH
jgi:hypothetical protein